jgi:2-polyprenyl-3-methyl-5-hydroxy-6-metoxy-1,4-benzoquinol methylase/uncharacterized Rossmann fold enzyme
MAEEKTIKRLDPTAKQNVEYCAPLWLRDEQIKLAIARVKDRIGPCHLEECACPIDRQAIQSCIRPEPCAIVCFGPSLAETWEQIKEFKYVFTCSGSHKFLIDRGIIPTWHVEVDPRQHKVTLLGTPHQGVEYLIASTCHPKVFDHLEGFNVKLWHVFDAKEDAQRTLPHGEWALTGGCSVGLRCMTIARFFGFTEQHVFGMDGNQGATGKHAAPHPSQAKDYSIVEYPPGSGKDWQTTTAFFEAARGTFHELNQMPDVKATFYGEGLVQAMAKDYVPNPIGKGKAMIGFVKPELISAGYCALNQQMHTQNLAYGVGGGKHSEQVLKLAESIKTTSILDYGCGKGYLAKAIPFPIWEYDPAVPGKQESPRAADLVVCTDVLEHIEPERLAYVLDDLRRCTKQVGYFTIHTKAAQKTLPDGRNTHLIQRGEDWWRKRLERFFTIGQIWKKGPELIVVVGQKARGSRSVPVSVAVSAVAVPA